MKETHIKFDYGYIVEEKVFLKGYLNFPDRQIGEVKINEEATLDYFKRRFELANQKVEDLYTLVDEAQNKGSYLMKLIHLREYLSEFDGLGNFLLLFKKLDELEESLKTQVSQNRVRNLEIKRALIEEAVDLTKLDEDWKEASEIAKELKMKWIKTGSVPKEMEEAIEDEFQKYLKVFFENRKEHFDSKLKVTRDRINHYTNIIDEAHKIKYSQIWDETADRFKKLHEEWKTIGKIPHKKATRMWERFREASDLFFEKYKGVKGIPNKPRVQRADPKVLLQEKICTEVESFLSKNEVPIEDAAIKTKDLMMKWRNVGIHPKMQNRDLQERFRNACDKIFETNYLVRVIKRKHPSFDDKPRADQLRIQIAVMNDLVRKDKMQLEQYEYEGRSMNSGNNRNLVMDKELQTKLNIQKRKISVKETLLDQYKQELTGTKNK